MEWYYAESTISPAETDADSSDYFVYERKNIRKQTRKDDISDEDYDFYVYEERKIPKELYKYVKENEDIQANVDYLLMLNEEE